MVLVTASTCPIEQAGRLLNWASGRGDQNHRAQPGRGSGGPPELRVEQAARLLNWASRRFLVVHQSMHSTQQRYATSSKPSKGSGVNGTADTKVFKEQALIKTLESGAWIADHNRRWLEARHVHTVSRFNES